MGPTVIRVGGQVNPEEIVFGGWDISSTNMADAMARAKVLDVDLQKQLRPYMEQLVPLPGIYDPDFIAANQGSRANHVITGPKKYQLQRIIDDIRFFLPSLESLSSHYGRAQIFSPSML